MSKSIFSYNVDVNKTAYLNWRTDKYDNAHNLTVLGEGFAQAAFLLMDQILIDNRDKKADGLILPILYDIDQAIEVYIKAILRLLNELNEEKVENYTSHDIESLFNQMVSKIKKKEITTKGLGKFLQPLSLYISDLYEKIKTLDERNRVVVNIDFARYPTDANGNPHFYVATYGNVVVDIENLRTHFKEVMDCLESIYLQYSIEREAFLEYKSEQRQMQLEYEAEIRAEYEAEMRAEFGNNYD